MYSKGSFKDTIRVLHGSWGLGFLGMWLGVVVEDFGIGVRRVLLVSFVRS